MESEAVPHQTNVFTHEGADAGNEFAPPALRRTDALLTPFRVFVALEQAGRLVVEVGGDRR